MSYGLKKDRKIELQRPCRTLHVTSSILMQAKRVGYLEAHSKTPQEKKLDDNLEYSINCGAAVQVD